MAVVAQNGNSVDSVTDNGEFVVTIRNYCRLNFETVMVSNQFMYDGDCWRLIVTKNNCYGQRDINISVTCQLQLVTMSSECADSRMAEMRCSSGKQLNEVFNQSGDTKDFQFNFKDSKVSDLILELSLYKAIEIVPIPVELPEPKPLVNKIEPPKSKMLDEVLKWFKTETFGDVIIATADGQKFSCHRDILSARSEVFKLMFNTPMKESEQNRVEIDCYEGAIVTAMLQFVYIDDCGEIGSIADRLYVAAHHYQLERLKILCESALAKNLSGHSVVKTFRLATFYHLDKLLAMCVDYLNTHKSELSMVHLLTDSLNLEEDKEVPTVQK